MIAADTPAVAGYGTASPKIQPRHRDRWAIVYVRQSSPQQVLEHRESAALQYALRERAIAWGWPAERVRIMDQDQGITATTADGRGGFQELLAEIALDHVGLILGFQMSRLSRRCVDWHQLLELCALFDVLLGDTDGLYDLRDYNDRLLLGIKGTLSPLYAGAYTWGRRAVNPRKKVPGRSGTGRTVVAPEHCQVFLPERSPAYIPWEQYQANRKQLADNQQRAAARGSPRDGPALVGGLVVCGTCGRRMTVQYQSGAHFRYACTRNVSDYAGPVCQSLRGDGLDELVGRLVLAALEPAALELSLAAQADVERERQRLEEHWRQRLERSRYDAERAARQYHAVEPENRLVARELERRWEGTLLEQRKVEEEHDRFQRQQPAALSEGEREDLRALAADLPALWRGAELSAAERKTVVRHLIERMVVTAPADREMVQVQVQWAGGFLSQRELVRPVARYEQLRDCATLLRRVGELRANKLTSKQIAQQLNEEHFRPPKRRATFTAGMVRQLAYRRGETIARPCTTYRLGAGEWWFTDLARAGVAPSHALPLDASGMGYRPAAGGRPGPLGPLGRRSGTGPPPPPAPLSAELARPASGRRPDHAQALAHMLRNPVTMEAV